MSLLLGTNVAHEVRRAVGVAIDVTVEARNTEARPIRTSIVDVVELLLRERRQQQTQPVELLRIQQALEQLVVVVRRDQLTLRNIPKVWLRSEVDRRRKLGQELVGQIEVQVEARQIAPCLAQYFVDRKVREEHAALRLLRMRQREKPEREQVLSLDLLRAQRRKIRPA